MVYRDAAGQGTGPVSHTSPTVFPDSRADIGTLTETSLTYRPFVERARGFRRFFVISAE